MYPSNVSISMSWPAGQAWELVWWLAGLVLHRTTTTSNFCCGAPPPPPKKKNNDLLVTSTAPSLCRDATVSPPIPYTHVGTMYYVAVLSPESGDCFLLFFSSSLCARHHQIPTDPPNPHLLASRAEKKGRSEKRRREISPPRKPFMTWQVRRYTQRRSESLAKVHRLKEKSMC